MNNVTHARNLNPSNTCSAIFTLSAMDFAAGEENPYSEIGQSATAKKTGSRLRSRLSDFFHAKSTPTNKKIDAKVFYSTDGICELGNNKSFQDTKLIDIENVYNEPFDAVPSIIRSTSSKVYSDLYFKRNSVLNVCKKKLNDFVQLGNNVLIERHASGCVTGNAGVGDFMPIIKVQNEEDFEEEEEDPEEFFDDDFGYCCKPSKMLNDDYDYGACAKTLAELSSRIGSISRPFSINFQDVVDLDEISPADDYKPLVNNRRITDACDEELPGNYSDSCCPNQNVYVLEPLLMEDVQKQKFIESVRLAQISEHKKTVRMMIGYTFAFFGLAISTFYIIYFA